MTNTRETIQIRVTSEEKAILKALANSKGLTLTDYIRNLCTIDVLKNMKGKDSEGESKQLGKAVGVKINLREQYKTILGGDELCNSNYMVTEQQRLEIQEFASRYGITSNKLLQRLLMAWLKAKVDNDNSGIGGIDILPRNQTGGNKSTISVTLYKKDREAIFKYLEGTGRKLSALITSLLDAVMEKE